MRIDDQVHTREARAVFQFKRRPGRIRAGDWRAQSQLHIGVLRRLEQRLKDQAALHAEPKNVAAPLIITNIQNRPQRGRGQSPEPLNPLP